MLFLKYSLNTLYRTATWTGETPKMQEAQVSKQELHYISPAHAIHCNSAVQCSSLWSTFGQSVSLSLSIETETETEHFQIQKTDKKEQGKFL